MSACLARRLQASCAAGCFKFKTMPRFPRLSALNGALSTWVLPAAVDACRVVPLAVQRRVESPSGGSTLITSAPMSHSCMAQKGPAITCVTSSTRIPSSAFPSLFMTQQPVPHAIFDVNGPLACLTFNRPEARNAMTWEMYESLVAACDRANADPAIRVLVLKGAGGVTGKAFVSGTDISQFTQFSTLQDSLDYERRLDEVFDRLERVEKPTIAQVEGVATGGGCVIALACDMRICTPEARFGVPI